jgi:hypothetical protein
MREALTLTTWRDTYGAWRIAAIVAGYRVERAYYGHTKREAVRLFRAAARARGLA